MKLGTKIAMGFGSLIVIVLLVGVAGYYGAVTSDQAIDEIGTVRLPSVASLLVISEAQTAVDSAENALLSRDIDLKARQEKYATFAAAWKRVEDAWKVYEPLPQTTEEAEVWKRFVPSWEAWKKDHQAYVAMSQEYDKTVEAQQKGAELFAKMAKIGDEILPVSFGKAMGFLDQMMEINRAKTDNAQAAFTRVDLLSTYLVANIMEAQTGISSSENALLDRSMDLAGRQVYYDRIAEAWKQADAACKGYEALEHNPEEAKLWKEFVPALDKWKADHETSVTLSKGYDTTVEAYLRSNELYKKMTEQALVTNAITFAPAEELLNKLVEINQKAANEASQAAITQASFMKAFSVVAMIVGVIVGCLVAVFIARGIMRPFKEMFKGLKTFSTQELKETGETFRQIIDGLASGSDQVASAAGQVSSASQSSAQGASEQASSLEETSSALEEMASMSKANAENADKANDLMSQTTHVVGQAQSGMKETSDAMVKINEASAKIAKIIKVIEEIAFQTNLLALNAAVEAARAGEHGKGFAVVADEVRNLAHRSAQAANETAQLISDTIDRVKKGTELNSELEKSFVKVNESAGQVASLVEQITGASKAQAKGVDEINAAMIQMDKVVQQSAAGAEESSAASEELASQAQVLQQTVDQLSAMVSGGNHSQGTRMTVAKESKKASPTPHTQTQRHPHPTPHAETHTEGSKGKGQWNEF
jgi:methyl-accepting chemotaxis protein